MDMRKRIKNGELFLDNCQGLDLERSLAKTRMVEFNQLLPEEIDLRQALKKEIIGKPTNSWIEPPFYFCYGKNIKLGNKCYINFNCNFIDDGEILIGDEVMFGANVTIATVGHPIFPEYRKFMYAEPMIIHNNCWIGSGAVIIPGITIGENTIIGAGSIVTKDIPANSIAVGNPCKVIREIDESDKKFYRKNRPIILSELAEVEKYNELG